MGLEAERQETFPSYLNSFLPSSWQLVSTECFKKYHCEPALKIMISGPYPRDSEGSPGSTNFNKCLSDSEAGSSSYM